MRNLKLLVLVCALSAAAIGNAQLALYNTGYIPPSGLGLPGTPDPYYLLTPPPLSLLPTLPSEIVTPNPAWNQTDSNAEWISIAGGGLSNLPPGGDWIYSYTLDLTGYNPSSVDVSGVWASDNAATMYVNGHDVASIAYGSGTPLDPYSFQVLSAFSFNGEYLHGGVNTLTFDVMNGNDANDTNGPTGLLVDYRSVIAATPEPITMGLGIAGVGIFLRRRLKARA